MENIFLDDKLTLIVSLPANNLDLARAAILGGADVLKVHINVEHRASKTRFGSFEEEIETLKNIVSLCKENNKPIGIVAGGHDKIPMSEIDKIVNSGFDFISLYDKHMNPLVFDYKALKMVALDDKYNLDYVKVYDDLPIDILECSIMKPETYGEELTVREIIQYKSVRNSTSKPIVIPTQRNIKPEQVKILSDIGVNGLMIGAIVTGKSYESILESTSKFRKAIDKLA